MKRWKWCLALVLAVAFLTLANEYPSEQTCEIDISGHKNCATYHGILAVLWHIHKALDSWGTAVTTLATIAVAAFAAVLWRSTDKLWGTTRGLLEDAQESTRILEGQAKTLANLTTKLAESVTASNLANEFAAENSQRQLRAYVSLEKIDDRPDGKLWNFRPIFVNSGETPTRRLINGLEAITLLKEPTVEEFFNGGGYQEPEKKISSGIIGPKLKVNGGNISIEKEEIFLAYTGIHFLYIFGFAEYNDVFVGTQRHRTEFCFRILVSKHPVTADMNCRYEFFGPYNGQDEDCHKKPYT
jgi:hypothetical protein